MPPKRQAPPPPEESDASGSGSEESESEEEAVPLASPPNKTQPPKPNNTTNNNEEDEEEEEEESGPESEPDKTNARKPASQPKPPPLAPTPGPESESESESQSRSGIRPAPTPTPAPRAANGNPKPNPMPTTVQQRTNKAGRFQRLFSLADEVAILRGLADYRADHGKLPPLEEFTLEIRKVITVDCDRNQLSHKIRRLKDKHNTAVKKHGGKDGVPDFKTPHDRTVFELSAKVWGDAEAKGGKPAVSENTTRHTDFDLSDGEESSGRVNGTSVSKPMRAAVAPGGMGMEGLAQEYPFLAEQVEELEKAHPCGKLLKRAFLAIDGGKASALDDKIKKHRVNEVKLHMRGAELTKEVVKALLDLVK